MLGWLPSRWLLIRDHSGELKPSVASDSIAQLLLNVTTVIHKNFRDALPSIVVPLMWLSFGSSAVSKG